MRLNSVLGLILIMTVTACKDSKKISAHVGQTYSLCTNEATGSTYQAYHFVDSTTWTWTSITHSGDDCQEADRIDTRFLMGKYIYDSDTKVLRELFLKEVRTAHDPGLVTTLNALPDTCNNNGNWAINVPVDITGLSGCDGGDFIPDTGYYDRANVTLTKDIFTIDGINLYP